MFLPEFEPGLYFDLFPGDEKFTQSKRCYLNFDDTSSLKILSIRVKIQVCVSNGSVVWLTAFPREIQYRGQHRPRPTLAFTPQ